jgi:hypothetical protein
MRTLTETVEWVPVVVFERAQDPYGPWVIDGPVADLTKRTAYLKSRLSGSYLWLPFQLASGEAVEVGDVVCMGPSNDEQIKKAVTLSLTQSGVPLGIVVGAPSDGMAPVAVSGLVPATITGLGSGDAGELITVNLTTGKAQRGTSAGVNYVLGRANGGGTLQLIQDQLQILA